MYENVGFLYRTDEFEGKLISSDEGIIAKIQ